MSPAIKNVLVIGVVALVLFLLITQPTQSAEAVQTALGWLRDGAEAIVTFVKSLFARSHIAKRRHHDRGAGSIAVHIPY